MLKPVPIMIAATAWFAGSTYWYDCEVKRVCSASMPLTQTAEQKKNTVQDFGPLTFRFGDARAYTGPTFAAFKANVLAKLSDDEALNIVGQFTTEEQTAAGNPAPDLGFQRAEQTKALFLDVLPAARIQVSSTPLDDTAENAVSKTRPFASVDFETRALVDPPLKVAPILFPVGKSNRHPTDGTREYLQAVAARIAAGKRATIEAFVDPRGQAATNLELAMARAASVREELVKYGAPIDRIDTIVDTSKPPIGDIETIMGRQQNRRAEITLR